MFGHFQLKYLLMILKKNLDNIFFMNNKNAMETNIMETQKFMKSIPMNIIQHFTPNMKILVFP